MHERLAIRALAFDEPFEYHPHITLAQGLTAAEVVERKELARRRWQEYRGPRGFTLGSMTFVRSADRVDWRDLGEVVLPNGRVL
jgi:2'-5' RNA ligase